MKTPREISPYSLIQEHLRDQPWRLLVAVIMLNQTSARQARPVWEEFFKIWPTPYYVWSNDPKQIEQTLSRMREVLRPIGFQNRRAERIWKMTEQFIFTWDGVDPLDLYGIGKYGADSYNIFVKGNIVEDVQDKELRNYVNWAKKISEDRK